MLNISEFFLRCCCFVFERFSNKSSHLPNKHVRKTNSAIFIFESFKTVTNDDKYGTCQNVHTDYIIIYEQNLAFIAMQASQRPNVSCLGNMSHFKTIKSRCEDKFKLFWFLTVTLILSYFGISGNTFETV